MSAAATAPASPDGLFEKVIREARAQNAFAEWEGGAGLAQLGPDIRRPRYEGDFATSTDAVFLLGKGVAVPQAAMNATRISVSKTLDKVMPDGAVQVWLQFFIDSGAWAAARHEVEKLYAACRDEIPVEGRAPAHDFDFRIATCPHAGAPQAKGGWIFAQEEAHAARHALAGEKAHVLQGVLLWQVALQGYARALKTEAEAQPGLPELFRERLCEFCTFLEGSALRLASFGALLPLALLAHEARTGRCDAGQAMQDFLERGGFVKRNFINVPAFLRRAAARFVPLLRATEKPPMASYEKRLLENLPQLTAPRMGVCAAAEALVRWARAPLRQNGQELPALQAYVNLASTSAIRT